MHILILNWRDTKNHASGGAEISLLNHVQYWQTKGVEITWVSSHFPGGKKDEVIDGIRYIRLGSHYTVHIRTFWYVITGNLKGIDVVIDAFHFIPYFSPLYLNKCKIIALINEPAKNAWFKNIWFPLSLLGYLLEPLFFIPYRNKQFITSSQTIATELEKYHLTKEQIVIIPHGTELPDNKVLPKKSKNPVIIFLAQLSPDKGIEDAIQAFVSVKKKRKDSEFWIVGKAKDDQYLEKLKQLVKSLHLSSQVTFLGFISKQKKFDVLAKSWVLVHPSIREGWGLNVIEANV
jgi:glycosyltransferase involved in cell wall biosynthesis